MLFNVTDLAGNLAYGGNGCFFFLDVKYALVKTRPRRLHGKETEYLGFTLLQSALSTEIIIALLMKTPAGNKNP